MVRSSRLGTVVWELSLWIFGFGTLAWDLSLGNLHLGTLALEMSLGIFRLAALVCDLRLGEVRPTLELGEHRQGNLVGQPPIPATLKVNRVIIL